MFESHLNQTYLGQGEDTQIMASAPDLAPGASSDGIPVPAPVSAPVVMFLGLTLKQWLMIAAIAGITYAALSKRKRRIR